MEALQNIYYLVPPQVWAFLIGTPAIVLFLNVCKRLLGEKKSTALIHILNVTTSFLIVAIPTYVLNNPKPWSWLGAYTATFFMFANLLYAICKAAAPFFSEVKDYEMKVASRASSIATAGVNEPLPAGYTYVSSTGGSTANVAVASVSSDPTIFEG